MTASPTVDRKRWLGCPVEIRQRHMAQEILVAYPAFTQAILEIGRLSDRCRNENKGLATLLLAGSGTGKTFLARQLQQRWPSNHSGDVSHVPVVIFSIPSAPTQRSLGSALLKALEDPKCRQGDAAELLDRAVLLMRRVKTRIICIDNVHDIPERRGPAGIKHLGNWIRDLIDKSQALVVLFGTPAARIVTAANAQLRRRVPKHIYLPYFDIESKASLARFRRFLHELDKQLPLAEPSNLSEVALARRLYFATYGILDYVFQLLTEAVGAAVRDAREHLTSADLEAAFDRVFGESAIGINPFAANGPNRALDRKGEPFHEWFDSSNPKLPGTLNA